MYELVDDGTLDTVLQCQDCAHEVRMNYIYDTEGITRPPSYDKWVSAQIKTLNKEGCEKCDHFIV